MTLFLLQPAPADNTLQWLLIGLGALTILFTVFRPSLKRKDPLSRSGSSLAQQRGVERDMQNLLVELSEMSRQISAQLDTRAAKLELLLREADEKIARLNSLDNAPRHPTVGSVSPALSDGGGQSLPSVAAKQASTEDAHSTAPPIDPRHQAIYELADQGQNVGQIARQLDRPSGEIELILALRPRST